MDQPRRTDRRRLARLRRLASRLGAALPLVALGCAAESPALAQVPTTRAAAPEVVAPAPPAAEVKTLPIGLDTVLRLAEGQNGQIALAREKVREAYAGQDLAKSAWLPQINVGTAYYRHEGGIQNEDGTLTHSSFGGVLAGMEVVGKIDLHEAVFAQVDAERKVWQQKGELSRVTSETLLDAASTYIDLMTARTGEAIIRRTVHDEEEILEQARGLAKAEPGVQFLVEGFESESAVLRQNAAKLRRQGDAAATKLAYLLGLGPGVELVPVDGWLIPIELVDPNTPAQELIARATTNGPGVRELQGLLALITAAREKAKGCGKFLPTVEVGALEGLFGAGPGGRMDFDNRLDVVVQARWNLTGLFTAKDQQRVADSRVRQVELSYEDVRAKLAAGVEEARQASLGGREELALAG
ncbi:MAG TPA: TolC family protein, partial [Gemmataceae bacterium]|nr:TolC family protein [Gemmataceae bacterium]